MKISTEPTPQQIKIEDTHPTLAATKVGAVDTKQAEKLKAAREFEQIFLRKMLSSLEKTGRASKEGGVSSGSDVYSSMVVGALADAMANAGGIGLADLITRATSPGEAQTPKATEPRKPR